MIFTVKRQQIFLLPFFVSPIVRSGLAPSASLDDLEKVPDKVTRFVYNTCVKLSDKNQLLIEREQKTFRSMLNIYCHAKHHTHGELCSECQALLEYANERVENCLFLPEKPVCARCPVHCYKEPWRARVREVMRFAGPRLIFKDPLAVSRHISLLLQKASDSVQQLRAKLTQKGS